MPHCELFASDNCPIFTLHKPSLDLKSAIGTTKKGRQMLQLLLVVILVISFSVSALAAKRQYDRASPDDCRIVNIAPSYAQTTTKGQASLRHSAHI